MRPRCLSVYLPPLPLLLLPLLLSGFKTSPAPAAAEASKLR